LLLGCGSGSGGNQTPTPAPSTQTAPAITAQPANQTVAPGGAATFTVAATGTPAPSFQWERSATGSAWAAIGGATSASYSFTAQIADGGAQFRAVASNGVGSPATSAAATLTVSTATAAPVLTTQPVAQTVTAGAVATFQVAATGNPAPAFQWQRSADGVTWTAIPGATSASYSFTATAADGGARFRAIASNGVGSPATSAAASLTVNAATAAPVLTTQPAALTVTAGAVATFQVAATGTPAPTFQWQRSADGVTWTAIPGATSASYSFTSTAADGGARFRAIASNGVGSPATSAAASLTVNAATAAPVLTTQPAALTVTVGAVATFQVAATGTPAPTFQWQRSADGVTWTAIPGATSASFSFTATAADGGAQFRAIASNGVGNPATSNAALLTVNFGPVFSSQPAPVSAAWGTAAVFQVAAAGNPPPTLQWERSGDAGSTWSPLAGATSATLTVASVTAADDGALFRVTATIGATAVVSQGVRLTVTGGATLALTPERQAMAAWERQRVTVDAKGAGPVTWSLFSGSGALLDATGTEVNVEASGLSSTLVLRATLVADPTQHADLTLPVTAAASSAAPAAVTVKAAVKTLASTPAQQSPGHFLFDGTPAELTALVPGDLIRVGNEVRRVTAVQQLEQALPLGLSTRSLPAAGGAPGQTAVHTQPGRAGDAFERVDLPSTSWSLSEWLGGHDFLKLQLDVAPLGLTVAPDPGGAGMLIRLTNKVLKDFGNGQKLLFNGEVIINYTTRNRVKLDPQDRAGSLNENAWYMTAKLKGTLTARMAAMQWPPDAVNNAYGAIYPIPMKITIPIGTTPATLSFYFLPMYFSLRGSIDGTFTLDGEFTAKGGTLKNEGTGEEKAIEGSGITWTKPMTPTVQVVAGCDFFFGISPVEVGLGILGVDFAGAACPVGLKASVSGTLNGTLDPAKLVDVCGKLSLAADAFAYLRWPRDWNFLSDANTWPQIKLTVFGYDQPLLKLGDCRQAPPKARISGEGAGQPGTQVVLSGRGSLDLFGGVLRSYRWTQVSGPAATFTGETTPTLTVTVPSAAPGSFLVFQLTVTDDDGDTDSTTHRIWVGAVPPLDLFVTSNLPRNWFASLQRFTGYLGNGVVLDAFGSGYEGGSVRTLRWKQTQGPAVALGDDTGLRVAFLPTQIGVYGFDLTVVDDLGRDETAFIAVEIVAKPAVTLDLLPECYAAPGTSLDLASGIQGDVNRLGVNWKLLDANGGSLGADRQGTVTYTPPATAGTYRVAAVAIADPSVSQVTRIVVTTVAGTPEIPILTVSPATPATGDWVTVSWTTRNAIRALLGGELAPLRAVGPSGSYSFQVTAAAGPSRVGLSAYDAAGKAVVRFVDVLVLAPGASVAIGKFTATRSTIMAGESTDLVWLAAAGYQGQVWLSPGPGQVAQGAGSLSVHPAQTTTYTLRASNGSSSATLATTVTVIYPPPVITSFEASQPLVNPGEPVTLRWAVQNATAVSIDNGVGALASTGTFAVVPSILPATYTLTAQNPSGTVTSQVFLSTHWVPGEVRQAGRLVEWRSNHQAILLQDGRVFIFGGTVASKDGGRSYFGQSQRCEIYDPRTLTSAPTRPSLQTYGTNCSGVLLDSGSVLMVSDFSTGLELFNPQDGTFALVGTIAQPPYIYQNYKAFKVASGEVAILNTDESAHTLQLFDPRTGLTRSGPGFTPPPPPTMPTPSKVRTYLEKAIGQENGTILISGSHDYTPDGRLSYVRGFTFQYDSLQNAYLPLQAIAIPGPDANTEYRPRLFSQGYLPVGDGKVLLTGGWWLLTSTLDDLVVGNRTDLDLKTTALFDLTNGKRTLFSGYSELTDGVAGTVLRDGRVLFCGGNQGDRKAVVLADPASGLAARVGTLYGGRFSHTVTRLPNGDVLIAGGSIDGYYGDSVEIYTQSTR
jgi:hypothetical protein